MANPPQSESSHQDLNSSQYLQQESMATANSSKEAADSAGLSAPGDKNPAKPSTINEDTEEDKTEDDTNQQRQIELEEEKKLKARHPCIQRPGSEFLQKRLQRGQKYFDSGDYNMAKASTNPNMKWPDGTTPVPAIDSKILNKRH